jgi:hypothetical protein
VNAQVLGKGSGERELPAHEQCGRTEHTFAGQPTHEEVVTDGLALGDGSLWPDDVPVIEARHKATRYDDVCVCAEANEFLPLVLDLFRKPFIVVVKKRDPASCGTCDTAVARRTRPVGDVPLDDDEPPIFNGTQAFDRSSVWPIQNDNDFENLRGLSKR